ncbi:MAG: UDP-N-acetylglucosamine 1-carboxyvinyltransferase [Lepagella sp.]
MSSFIVEGGHPLSGEIRIKGAKNEALEVICAVLLTPEKVVISNLPHISDVRNLISLLADMGVKVNYLSPSEVEFQADSVDLSYILSEEYRRKSAALRGSVMVMGPLLARFGKALMPRPGGDKIGRRRLDTHFIGFQNLGATFSYASDSHTYTISAPPEGLKGCYMLLDEASVTGTANIVMAAVLAHGVTTIYNAACEPYIQQLCRLLVRMGARIDGIGSNLLTITGVDSLGGAHHTLLPDMIEVGSFIGMAAMTGSNLLLKDVGINDLGMLPSAFQRIGINLDIEGNDIRVNQKEIYQIEEFIDGSIMTIADAPWPGLSPDLLSIFLVVATQAKGSLIIHQKMFESRLFFVDKLLDMGARVVLCDPHRAVVIGAGKFNALRATDMVSPDIRAGIAMLIAALGAKGTSRIQNINQIDRGYEDIEGRLNNLGAKILRVD